MYIVAMKIQLIQTDDKIVPSNDKIRREILRTSEYGSEQEAKKFYNEMVIAARLDEK